MVKLVARRFCKGKASQVTAACARIVQTAGFFAKRINIPKDGTSNEYAEETTLLARIHSRRGARAGGGGAACHNCGGCPRASARGGWLRAAARPREWRGRGGHSPLPRPQLAVHFPV